MDFPTITEHEELIKELFNNAGADFSIEAHGDHVSINNFVGLPVHDIESSANTEQDVHINDSSGQFLAILCATSVAEKPYAINELSIPQLISFIFDVTNEQFGTSKNHTFKSHYLLVNKNFIDQYKNEYLESSALWGGFTHEIKRGKYKKQNKDITLPNQIFIPSLRHKADLAKAISASSGFDRFLKLYHQLELLFDVIFVSKIRSLPKENIEGFSTVIKDYQRKELDILKNILKDYTSNPSAILNIMKNCPPYIDVMDSVFQDNSKDGNPNAPDKSTTKWINFLSFLQGSDHTSSKAKELGLVQNPKDDQLEAYILQTAAYWIYRIRCSIAHNKIGEFIFNDSHEEFVVEIGERLIKEVIQQIFSNSQLKAILAH